MIILLHNRKFRYCNKMSGLSIFFSFLTFCDKLKNLSILFVNYFDGGSLIMFLFME
jgi:hypothetical protein